LSQEFQLLKSRGTKALEEAKSYLRIHAFREESLSTLTVRLSGALDTRAIKALMRRLTRMARQSQEKIVVDLSGLAFALRGPFIGFLSKRAALKIPRGQAFLRKPQKLGRKRGRGLLRRL